MSSSPPSALNFHDKIGAYTPIWVKLLVGSCDMISGFADGSRRGPELLNTSSRQAAADKPCEKLIPANGALAEGQNKVFRLHCSQGSSRRSLSILLTLLPHWIQRPDLGPGSAGDPNFSILRGTGLGMTIEPS